MRGRALRFIRACLGSDARLCCQYPSRFYHTSHGTKTAVLPPVEYQTPKLSPELNTVQVRVPTDFL